VKCGFEGAAVYLNVADTMLCCVCRCFDLKLQVTYCCLEGFLVKAIKHFRGNYSLCCIKKCPGAAENKPSTGCSRLEFKIMWNYSFNRSFP